MFVRIPHDLLLNRGPDLSRIEELLRLVTNQKRTLTVSGLLLFVALVRRGIDGTTMPLSFRDLADELGIPIGSLSRQFDALENFEADGGGWIERQLDRQDLRHRRIVLTDSGKQMARRVARLLDRADISGVP